MQLHLLPRMVMSTGSSSKGCAVNTDTAATQMARDSSRLQRALSTPTNRPESGRLSDIYMLLLSLSLFSLQKKKTDLFNMHCHLTCL